MNIKDMIPVIATKDGDCHWFLIPNELYKKFSKDLEKSEESDDYEDFIDAYSKYMTGGDVNNIQLYIKKINP